MSFSDCIAVCNNARLDGYVSWWIDGQVYGRIAPAFAGHLECFPDVFSAREDGFHLHSALQGREARSRAVAPVLRELHRQGVIDTWVEELYPVQQQFGGEVKLDIERAAASFMGIRSFGVHVNGLVHKAAGLHVWTGVRSRSKPFWPGKYDQMVAGGQPSHISLLDNVIKEAAEEASVPEVLAATATPVGQIRYQQQGWRGLEDSTLFIYDLYLPEGFEPVNTDGEVECFELMSLPQLAELTAQVDAFKDNCNLVNIDLLIRQGLITQIHPEYAALCKALYDWGE